jgi:methionyl-tRNA synthetase
VTAARRFYLTTPIYYVNARPHLGHAYTTIVADAMCRYRRLAGDRVYLLTGTDEHGDKIAQAAAQAEVSPQAYADEISAAFRDTWRRLGITNDDFIRTTEARHQQVVRAILQKLWDAGEIYFGKYGGQYCYGCERFYTEKEIVDGKCPDHQTPLTYIEEENYFFRMSKYQQWLVDYIDQRPTLIRPERYRNEILGFLREPLQDLSISRPRARLAWGIPLPFDDRFVTYVWFDALINYASALGGPGADAYETFWPHVRHLIGKDILKPHGVYWPCMLQAAGMPVFRELDVHAYWTVNGQKMSKSLGNVVEPVPMQDKYGEAFRYFLLREPVFGLDSDFSEEALVRRLNADLANDLGNLVSRATTMIVNFAGSDVATASPPGREESAVQATLDTVRREVDSAMEQFAFQRALVAIWEFIATVNGYIDAVQPWALAKDPAKRDRLDTVLSTLYESLRCLAILLDAFLPQTAAKIRDLIGVKPERLADLEWRAPDRVGRPTGAGRNALHGVRKAEPLFPRVTTLTGPTTLGGAVTQPVPHGRPPAEGGSLEPTLAQITIDDFRRIELRVAEVLAAEPVPKSRKLLKLTVNAGETAPRTLVAGIAEHYAPADLVGKKVIVVANLEPVKLMGIESRGMVLAGSADATLAVLGLDRDLPPGARVS